MVYTQMYCFLPTRMIISNPLNNQESLSAACVVHLVCLIEIVGSVHWILNKTLYFEFPIWTHIHVIPTGDLQCLMDHVLHMYIYILYYDMYIHAYTWYIHIIDTHHSKKHVHSPQLILAIELVFRLNPALLGRNGHWFLVIWTSPFFCCSTSMG